MADSNPNAEVIQGPGPNQGDGWPIDTNPAPGAIFPVNIVAGGGGGGPVTIADGADVAEGATTDAAVTTDSPGTVSGKLRGLVAILADVWDNASNWLRVGAGQVGAWAVTVSNFPASQAVNDGGGSLSVDDGGVPLGVTVSNFPAVQPVSFATPVAVEGATVLNDVETLPVYDDTLRRLLEQLIVQVAELEERMFSQ